MLASVEVLPEPALEFRHAQRALDPRDGLSLFGPFDTEAPGRPTSISYGLIGTEAGIRSFLVFSPILASPVADNAETTNLQLWPPYPGFDSALHADWPAKPTRTHTLDDHALEEAAQKGDAHQRAFQVVTRFLDGIEDFRRSAEERIDLAICVVPEYVWRNCRPLSHVIAPVGSPLPLKERKRRASGQLDLSRSYEPEPYRYSVDFRRQLKARSMYALIPIQLIRESTLRIGEPTDENRRTLTPLSDRAWNVASAAYYKAGGKPWRLSTARDGVCYVGLVYHRTPREMGDRTACCAAQMFLDTGDGVVLRGEFGKWYSPDTHEMHLSKDAARDLMSKVLREYEGLPGKVPLREVFLHYRSSITDLEFEGFKAACPSDVRVTGVHIRPERRVRLFRQGTRPVIRGTFWETSARSGYLWSSGFKDRLGTYDGWETPVPQRLVIEFGDAKLRQVATDIFGLTKLNYNSCRFGDSRPVTIGFSESVGEILVSNPTVKMASSKFRYYM
jgi:hypothetical protein